MSVAPPIEPRALGAILEDLREHLASRKDRRELAELLEQLGSRGDGDDPLGEAIMAVFSRYSELIIERLNQVPDKHHRAFVKMLGVLPTPAVPARVPLSFSPVKQLSRVLGDGRSAFVPARVQVAAEAPDAKGEAVVFETERPLRLSAASLQRAIAVDPGTDRFSDLSRWVRGEAGGAVKVFAGDQPMAHVFHIGLGGLPDPGDLLQIRLDIQIDNPPRRPPKDFQLEWFMLTSKGCVVLEPLADGTRQLTQSGSVVFEQLPAAVPQVIQNSWQRWLGCRLRKAIAGTGAASAPVWVPRLSLETFRISWKGAPSAIRYVLYNQFALDSSQDFFPFGQRPKFGDTWYIGSDAFVHGGLELSLEIALSNPASAGDRSPIPPTHAQGRPLLRWELACGNRWVELEVKDGTRALTESGPLSFTLPAGAGPGQLNGIESGWIRVRLMGGDYGKEEDYLAKAQSRPPAERSGTLAPPAIRSLGLAGAARIASIVTENGFVLEQVDGSEGSSFAPFHPVEGAAPALYLGFAAPEPSALAEQPLELYVAPEEPAGRRIVRSPEVLADRTVKFDYWTGLGWKPCPNLRDGTLDLSRSGVISLGLGDDLEAYSDSTLDPRGDFRWVRMSWQGTGSLPPPGLKRIALNTVFASQGISLSQELLGSSGGGPNQAFRSLRAPVLGSAQLQVREVDRPSPGDIAALLAELGQEDLEIVEDSQGSAVEVWVSWQEVESFLRSGPTDRHFTLDRSSGRIRFGDGVHGRIPGRGANNLRLKRYRTGGGARGNQPAAALTRLRSAVAFVDSVANPDPARGGQDAESWNSVRMRSSRWLRHRDRAVTQEDFEDLALRASPEVARARCFPLRDLEKDPAGSKLFPGVVSLILVPHSLTPCPKPDLALLSSVRDFLRERCAFDVELVVMGPEYVRISVTAQLGEPRGANPVDDPAARLEGLLNAYLDTLKGSGGEGWGFGEHPHISDLYGLLGAEPGLPRVESMTLTMEEERPGLLAEGRFLIGPGTHRLRLA